MNIRTWRGGYSLVSGSANATTGSAIDTRAASNFGFLVYSAAGASGIFNFEGSHDLTGWMIDSTITAATGVGYGTAQISKWYPYVRANLTTAYSGGGLTAAVNVFYGPGLT